MTHPHAEFIDGIFFFFAAFALLFCRQITEIFCEKFSPHLLLFYSMPCYIFSMIVYTYLTCACVLLWDSRNIADMHTVLGKKKMHTHTINGMILAISGYSVLHSPMSTERNFSAIKHYYLCSFFPFFFCWTSCCWCSFVWCGVVSWMPLHKW